MQYATLYATSLFLKTYYLVYILFKYSIYKCYFIFQIKLGVVQLKSRRKPQKIFFVCLLSPFLARLSDQSLAL